MKQKPWKRALSLVLAFALVFAMPCVTCVYADGVSVDYVERRWDSDRNVVDSQEKTANNCTQVYQNTTQWDTGWYVAEGTVTFGTDENPTRVEVKGDVNLILTDGCNLTITGGIQVPEGKSLTIYGQSAGTGQLTATAQRGTLNAGIGGNGSSDSGETGGAIIIHGGKVTATGNNGAGIGGSSGSAGGTVTIFGGTVEATGGYGGAGIGGGAGGAGGEITIYGGKITARGTGNYGAGIGGGGYGPGGSINIYGGEVEATGGGGGAGIGGGNSANGGTITISGGKVEATGGGAGIGGGDGGGDGGTITISGGEVEATGGDGGAGIGGGYGDNYGGDGGNITISGGKVTATGGYSGAGIGDGYNNEGESVDRSITISGGEVKATGGDSGGAGLTARTITISNDGTVEAKGRLGISGENITITGGHVTATGGGDGTQNGDGVGIGSTGTIAISGGEVKAEGSGGGAGIGGGQYGDGSITISDGTVTATGGDGGGAGIGAGIGGTGSVNISGGEVEATGGGGGAGIGGGEDSYYTSTITISGGTMQANGGGGGAGIGGGEDSRFSSIITISGGTMQANGGGGGAGIGGGEDSRFSSIITISGGTVTATGGASGGAGIGDGLDSKYNGTFSTTEGGTAVIFAAGIGSASAIADQDSNGTWSGIIFEKDGSATAYTGTVYGEQTLQNDLTLPKTTGDNEVSIPTTLAIPAGASLVVPDGKKLTVNKDSALVICDREEDRLSGEGTLAGGGNFFIATPLPTLANDTLTYNGTDQFDSLELTYSENKPVTIMKQEFTVVDKDCWEITGENWNEIKDAGTYSVTFSYAGFASSDTVTVKPAELALTPAPAELTGGGTVTFTLSNLPEGVEAEKVTVTCSDDSIEILGGEASGTWTATLPNRTQKYTFTTSYSDTNYNVTGGTCTVSVWKAASGPSIGSPLPNAFSQPEGCVSDTLGSVTVNGAYQFRLTSTNGAPPTVELSSDAFRAELASQEGNDYFWKVYAVGQPGQTCTVIVNGTAVANLTAASSASGGVVSDTTAPFTVAAGGSYQFRLTADAKPTMAAGSPSFTVEYVGNEGRDWFFKVYAVGKPGDGCGFYVNGAPTPVAVAHVS